ncbi:hypothetical protein EDC04DRAFT_1148275 [Pisolithus marmoratus]|nr:hypothetical protein EDC04DRAFT_1148275 [Pisolithus marmoratus]
MAYKYTNGYAVFASFHIRSKSSISNSMRTYKRTISLWVALVAVALSSHPGRLGHTTTLRPVRIVLRAPIARKKIGSGTNRVLINDSSACECLWHPTADYAKLGGRQRASNISNFRDCDVPQLAEGVSQMTELIAFAQKTKQWLMAACTAYPRPFTSVAGSVNGLGDF